MNRSPYWWVACFAMSIALILPSPAEAFIWRVAYNDAGRPTSIQKNDVIRAIQQTLREWEHGSTDGRVIARYTGEVSTVWSEDDLLIIDWRPIGGGACAQTCRRTASGTCTGGVLRGEIQMNSLRPGNCFLNPLWTPPLAPNVVTTRGASFQSVLLHELAHQFRDIGFDDARNNNSVLSIQINDLANRHLWNTDHGGVATIYGSHAHGIRVQLQDSSSHQIVSSVDIHGSDGDARTPVAISMADGVTPSGYPSRHFTLAWMATYYYGLSFFIAQHDGSVPFWFWVDSTTQASTLKRPCVAVNGLHQVVVFTANAQSPDLGISDQFAGSRSLLQMESHNGGYSFTTPEVVPGLRTRQGVACTIDPSNGRVVLAATGLDETIYIAHRLASAVGPSAWSAFTLVNAVGAFKVPQTRDVPEIVFDRFQSSALGRLAWLENATLTHRVAEIGFDGTSYQLNPFANPPVVERQEPTGSTGIPTYQSLRTNPVMSYDGVPVFHLMTSQWNTMTAFSQWNYGSASNNYLSVPWSFPPAPVTWYTGAAQHPVQFQTATVQWMLLNPN